MSTGPDRHVVPVWPGERDYKGIGPSHLSAFASCPQKAAFNYELRIEPREDRRRDPAKIGDLVHAGLAYRYGAMLQERPSWMVYESGHHAIEVLGSDRPELVYEARRIFAWYEHYYQDDPFQPILVEKQLNIQLEDEWVSVRMDLLAWDRHRGEIVVADHKVHRTLSKNRGNELSCDRQMLMLLAILRSNGYDVKRVILNGMTRDYPEPKFKRLEVPVSPQAYGRLGTDTLYYLRARRAIREKFPDPYFRPRNHDACMSKYGLCEFDQLCRVGYERLDDYVQK